MKKPSGANRNLGLLFIFMFQGIHIILKDTVFCEQKLVSPVGISDTLLTPIDTRHPNFGWIKKTIVVFFFEASP